MVLTGVGTATVDAGKTYEHHLTVTVGLHGVAQLAVGHGKNLAENIVSRILLQKGVFALTVRAVKMGRAGEQYAEIFKLR